MRLILPLFITLFSIQAFSATYNEAYHVDVWCKDPKNPIFVTSIKKSGQVEAVQVDKTRVDCLTDDYAIEFDWASKYNEAIGQSLGYSLRTLKRPGIVLIMKSDSDEKYWNRLQEIIIRYNLPIQTWKMKAIQK